MYRKPDFSPKYTSQGSDYRPIPINSYLYHVLFNIMCGCGNKRSIIIIIIMLCAGAHCMESCCAQRIHAKQQCFGHCLPALNHVVHHISLCSITYVVRLFSWCFLCSWLPVRNNTKRKFPREYVFKNQNCSNTKCRSPCKVIYEKKTQTKKFDFTVLLRLSSTSVPTFSTRNQKWDQPVH